MLQIRHVIHLTYLADLSANPCQKEDWRLAKNPETNLAVQLWVSRIGPNPRQTLFASSVCYYSITQLPPQNPSPEPELAM